MQSAGDPRPTAVLAHPSPDLYGSDRMLVESVRGLTEEWRVVVTLPADGPLAEVLRSAGAVVRVLDVPVLRKAYMSPGGLIRLGLGTLRTLGPAVRLLRRERARLLYANTLTVPIWLLAARVAGVRVLCHVHEAEDGVSAPVKAALAAPLRLAHDVVVNSRASAGALGARIRDDRLHVIYNGVPGPPHPRPVRDRPTEPVHLVLVGRLSPRKGTDVAIEAVRLLRERGTDVRLTAVGDVFPGYEWFERRLRELAAALPDDAVRLTGFRESVWDAFDEADIALVPSRVEPFGNVAVEAMLAGRPVVASSAQGLTEIVSDGENGVLVTPGDPAALAAGVERLLEDWEAAVTRAVKARDEAVGRFGVGRYYQQVRNVANAALEARSSGQRRRGSR